MKTIKDRNYSFNHVKKRLEERYNLDINIKDYDNLNWRVSSDKYPISTEIQRDDIQKIYNVLYKEKWIKVVYSDKRNLITTVLPKGKGKCLK